MNIHVQKAVDVLNQGGVIGYPTEGVWGLGCDPWDSLAVQRILNIKHRSSAKGLILIAGANDQVETWLEHLPASMLKKINQTWPGPVTWLVPATSWMPEWLTGGQDTLAIRVTNHPLVQQVCAAFDGPIVSTSANRSGRRSATSQLQVQSWFGRQLDYILPGHTLGRKGPSEIYHAATGEKIR